MDPVPKALQISTTTSILLFLIASLLGSLRPLAVYSTEAIAEQFVPTDLFNLIFIFPILLYSLYRSQDSEVGQLTMIASLFYLIYINTIYLLGVPYDWISILLLFAMMIGLYSCITQFVLLDHQEVKVRLGAMPHRVVIALLSFIAIFFSLLQVSTMLTTTDATGIDLGTWVADLLVFCGPIFMTAILLYLRHPAGYTGSYIMLYVILVTFAGLIPFVIFQQLLYQIAIDLFTVIFVLVFVIPIFVVWYRLFGLVRSA